MGKDSFFQIQIDPGYVLRNMEQDLSRKRVPEPDLIWKCIDWDFTIEIVPPIIQTKEPKA